MQIETRLVNEVKIAEVVSDELIIRTPQDGLDLLGNIYYEGFDRVILLQRHITPDFFDLKTGIAGEILQKFSNYRIRLAVVGDFSVFSSESLRDFISESNRNRGVNFVSTISEALRILSIG